MIHVKVQRKIHVFFNNEVKALLLVYQNTHFQLLPVDYFFFRVGASTNDQDTFLLIWIFSIYLFFFLEKSLYMLFGINTYVTKLLYIDSYVFCMKKTRLFLF